MSDIATEEHNGREEVRGNHSCDITKVFEYLTKHLASKLKTEIM